MRRQLVAQITAYLEGRINLAELVDWAEELVLIGFEANPAETEIMALWDLMGLTAYMGVKT